MSSLQQKLHSGQYLFQCKQEKENGTFYKNIVAFYRNIDVRVWKKKTILHIVWDFQNPLDARV